MNKSTRIRQLKDALEEIEEPEYDINDDKPTVIEVKIRAEAPLWDAYAPLDKRVLDSGVVGYIRTSCEHIPLAETLEIRLDTNGAAADTDARVEIEQAFKKGLKNSINARRSEIRRVKRTSFIMLLFGIFVLGVSIALTQLPNKFQFISQTVQIMSWVFVWTSVEGFFFDNNRTKFKILKDMQLFTAKFVIG